MSVTKRDVIRLPHHKQQELCTTRAKYRQGKKFTSVKVYTINNESQHLLVCGVPALGLQDELRRKCSRFGDIKSLVYIPRYAEEEFTDAYHIQYTRIQSARYAKCHMDCKSFYGGVLHVCYAPEMESLEETKAKLIQRRKDVAKRTRKEMVMQSESCNKSDAFPKQYHRQKKHPALPITSERLLAEKKDVSCIWQGIPCEIDPRTITPAAELLKPSTFYGPLKPDDRWLQAGIKERRFIPNKSSTVSVACAAITPVSNNRYGIGSSSNISQALRFIPRQVQTNKRIVFRNKSILEPVIPEVSNDSMTGNEKLSLKRDGLYDSATKSVEKTIYNVRKKIRAVSAPKVQLLLEENVL